jgi:hypothetical protein
MSAKLTDDETAKLHGRALSSYFPVRFGHDTAAVLAAGPVDITSKCTVIR